MPVIHRFGPYRFFFYSHENQDTREPPHIHVISGDGEASFWLSPVALREVSGLHSPRDRADPSGGRRASRGDPEALA
jgi:hypothetical protein